MDRFNKLFAALIGVIVAGISGDPAAPGYFADLLPAEVLPYAVAAIPVLVALVPNGRPFWQIDKPSVGV